MNGKRMTERKVRFEIFLIVLRGIRSVFFNLFMLALGFAIGFGFCEQYHRVFNHREHQNFQSWVNGKKQSEQMNSTTNSAEGVVLDGK